MKSRARANGVSCALLSSQVSSQVLYSRDSAPVTKTPASSPGPARSKIGFRTRSGKSIPNRLDRGKATLRTRPVQLYACIDPAAMRARPVHSEPPRDLDGADALRRQHRCRRAVGARPLYLPSPLALVMPSRWRARTRRRQHEFAGGGVECLATCATPAGGRRCLMAAGASRTIEQRAKSRL